MIDATESVRLHAIAREIAAALGPEWTGARDETMWRRALEVCNRSAGVERIRLLSQVQRKRVDGRQMEWIERWKVYGDLPHDSQGCAMSPYGIESPSITVAATRPPAEIAREITRRVLPGYRAALADVQRRQREMDTRAAVVAEVANHLQAAAGSRLEVRQLPCSTPDSTQRWLYGRCGEGYVDVRIFSPSEYWPAGAVAFELRLLTPAQADRVLRALMHEGEAASRRSSIWPSSGSRSTP